jgi:hypothetical protein
MHIVEIDTSSLLPLEQCQWEIILDTSVTYWTCAKQIISSDLLGIERHAIAVEFKTVGEQAHHVITVRRVAEFCRLELLQIVACVLLIALSPLIREVS